MEPNERPMLVHSTGTKVVIDIDGKIREGRINAIKISGRGSTALVEYEVVHWTGSTLAADWIWSRFVQPVDTGNFQPIGFHAVEPLPTTLERPAVDPWLLLSEWASCARAAIQSIPKERLSDYGKAAIDSLAEMLIRTEE